METGLLIRRKLLLLSLFNPVTSYQISKQYTVPPICLPETCDCEVKPGIPLPNECRRQHFQGIQNQLQPLYMTAENKNKVAQLNM